MSKFDLDQLLKDLGVPQNARDREAEAEDLQDADDRSAVPGPTPRANALGATVDDALPPPGAVPGLPPLPPAPRGTVAGAPTSSPAPAPRGASTPGLSSAPAPAAIAAAAPAPAARGATTVFKRTDPADIPRPPDATGSGLDHEIDPTRLAAEPDGRRIRPTDAVQLLWEPTNGRYTGIAGMAPLPDLLVERGIVTPAQMKSAKTVVAQSPARRLVDVLVEMGADDAQVQAVVAELHGMTFVSLPTDEIEFNPIFSNKLGVEFCKAQQVLPLYREGRVVVVGSTRPDDLFLLDEVRRIINARAVRHVLVTASGIAAMLDVSAPGDGGSDLTINQIMADLEDISTDEASGATTESDDPDGNIEQADDAPIIKMVFHILQTAVKEGASDIHIEPEEKKSRVRLRIDGELFETMNLPRGQHGAILSRMKIISNLDIAERRLPQDGRTRYKIGGRQLDFRVSTLPTIHGEKCVIRILDDRSISVGLNDLGFDESTLHIWSRQIDQPHGIILVTGPTGSGKTTTLYSSLRQMDVQHLNVSTVEDPVEYHLDGISQVQIHERIGMTFAAALRSLLRQDPDVVMVGEIRDGETARIAVQAALTGHLVLSTLHTNDAPSSVTRLINIGVEGFLIGAALNAVLAQRLVRKICSQCKQLEVLSDDKAEFLALQGIHSDSVYMGKGCDRCRETGYSGRSGIYELLILDDVTRDAIARQPNVTEFRRMCIERGMVTLRQDGIRKVVSGITTIDEVMRVTEATI